MNYISVINNFWTKHRQTPVSAGAVALFFTILNHANKNRWQFPLHLTNTFLQAELHTSKSSFLRYRNELSENGYIVFFPINSIVGCGYSITLQTKKRAAESAYITSETTDTNPETTDTDCGANHNPHHGANNDTTFNTENRLSSYNNKNININKNINKNFKQNSLYKKEKYNAKEIYDSGRYDFEAIERVARKRIREALAKDDDESETPNQTASGITAPV